MAKASKYKKTRYPEPSNKRTKVGRCWFVNGLDGKPINYLSWNKANGVYYYTKDKGVTFGVYYKAALFKFSKFMSDLEQGAYTKLNKPSTKNSFQADADIEINEEFLEGLKKFNIPLSEIIQNIKVKSVGITEAQKFEIVKNIFAEYTPVQIANRTGIQELANLYYIMPPTKSLNLDELVNLFTKRNYSHPISP